MGETSCWDSQACGDHAKVHRRDCGLQAPQHAYDFRVRYAVASVVVHEGVITHGTDSILPAVPKGSTKLPLEVVQGGLRAYVHCRLPAVF
eukprot:910608-Pyramimonas_sp.AAC.1